MTTSQQFYQPPQRDVTTPLPNVSINSCCEHCRAWVAVRIQLVVDDGACWRLCGRCTVEQGARWRAMGVPVMLVAFWHPMINPFCTGDGRYFANGDEATRQQRAYQARCASYFRRVQRIFRAAVATQQQSARIAS